MAITPADKMHENEVHTDISLVKRLLVAQFPRWADLSIRPVQSAGTDHAIYRLGNDLAVRMPRTDSAVGQGDKECRWLPRLALFLPLAIRSPSRKASQRNAIHPFSDSRNNDPRNGLALTRNMHWAFDEGLWSVADGYRVVVARDR